MRLKSAAQWFLAAVVVFQVSATVGAAFDPPETLTAVRLPPRASSGR